MNMDKVDKTNIKMKKPSRIEEMTREQMRQAILKKRECNARAQRIVECLLEKGISEQYLLKCLADINQSHFEDVIEERSIIQLCGYPICQNTISEKDIPKQKYRISLKTNKVFDITARKNFCSNSCYKSAIYIKKQMLTSPLWFREHEEIPKFHLLPMDAVGSMGQEVDVSLIERVKINSGKKLFTSIHDFTDASLHEITGHNIKGNENSKENDDGDATENEIVTNEVNIHETNVDSNTNLLKISMDSKEPQGQNITTKLACFNKNISFPKLDKSYSNIKKTHPNPLNIVGEIVEKPEKRIDPILCSLPDTPIESTPNKENKKKLLTKKPPLVTALSIEVEKCLAEWFTLDTMLFLFGEEKVKEMVSDKAECIKEYLNNYAKSIFYNSNAYDQYQALCRKLNMLELEDRRQDSQTLQRETKPLPDYTILQEESKNIQIKVKAFFAGETVIPEPEISESIPLPNSAGGENFTQLPLVDKNAQNALRRKIVCEHLNKVLPDLLQSLGLLSLSISADVRLLVNTFKLKANNIMFKPIQWTLIAIIFIKLLSLRDQRLEYLLEQQTAYKHMQLLLLSYKQDGGYLDRLISWLTDIDRLLDTNDTQLTVE